MWIRTLPLEIQELLKVNEIFPSTCQSFSLSKLSSLQFSGLKLGFLAQICVFKFFGTFSLAHPSGCLARLPREEGAQFHTRCRVCLSKMTALLAAVQSRRSHGDNGRC